VLLLVKKRWLGFELEVAVDKAALAHNFNHRPATVTSHVSLAEARAENRNIGLHLQRTQ